MPTLTPEAWAQIRYDYEHTNRPVDDICLEDGTTANTLRHRARRWGWKMRRPAIPADGPPPLAVKVVSAPDFPVVTSCRPDAPHPDPLPASGEREYEDADTRAVAPPTPDIRQHEPSPHLESAPTAGRNIGAAIGRAMSALDMTLGSLASGPLPPRQMEQTARALSSLTRTLRELHGLLGRQNAGEPKRDAEELRRSLARKLDAVVEQEREDMPRRYLAGWQQFAAEAEAEAEAETAEDGEPETLGAPPRLRRL